METRRLEEFILEKMSETGLPGLSIAITDAEDTIYARAFGFRDVEQGLRATPRTSYCVGSVTKSFTALAILQLAEEGLLDLEDPVGKYIPLGLRPGGEEIRVKHLLTHASGLPALGYAEALIRNVVGDDTTWLPIATPDDVVSFVSGAGDWVEARPGERFFYLNEGYVLLGRIIEVASGRPYEDYVRERILAPLGMERSYFSRGEFDRDVDKATPYVLSEGRRIPSTYPFGISADGGLISNVLDLSRYLRMFLNRGEADGIRILSEEGIREMEEPRIPLPYEVFGGEAYAYGWVVVPSFMGHRLVGHGGSVLVSTAYVGYLPEDGLGVAVLSNASGYPMANIAFYALALALGEEPEEIPLIKHERLLEKLAGEYRTYMGSYGVRISRRGDFLFLEVRGRYIREELPLVPERLEEREAFFFTFEDGRRLVAEFRIREDGRVELVFERYKFRKVGPG